MDRTEQEYSMLLEAGQSHTEEQEPHLRSDGTKNSQRSTYVWATTLTLLFSWGSFLFPFLWIVGFLIWLPMLLWLFVRARRYVTLLFFILSPCVAIPIFSFTWGVVGYFRSTAVLRASGYPGPEFYNLDPKKRLYRSTSGCIVTGIELFTHIPNNVAVNGLVHLFGPMKNSYVGAYPTRKTVWTLMRGAQTLHLKSIQEKLQVPLEKGKKITLPSHSLSRLGIYSRVGSAVHLKLHFRILKNGLLLIGNEKRTMLFALQRKEIVAVYVKRKKVQSS